jgi:hypothetical protein
MQVTVSVSNRRRENKAGKISGSHCAEYEDDCLLRWYSVCLKTTSKFRTIAIFKSFVK